ncbi:DUF554 domain-containing protein, partial [Listeria monocytogenes]|nr:DUF554 domain-containing protein [Listeria monocytogenes]
PDFIIFKRKNRESLISVFLISFKWRFYI